MKLAECSTKNVVVDISVEEMTNRIAIKI